MELVRDDSKAGQALAVMNAGGGVATYVPVPNPRHWKPIPGLAAGAAASQPKRSFPAPALLPAKSCSVMAGRCRLTVLNPVLKVPSSTLPALEM